MAKNVHFSDEAMSGLKRGVDTLADAVKSTLGPRGRFVLLSTNYKLPHPTKDGVTVADEIELADPLENLGAQIVKQAAQRTGDVAGDGTTTSTVLAQAILDEGVKYLKAGVAPSSLKRGLDVATSRVASYIKDNAITIDIDSQFDKVKEIATISANSDSTIGELVAEAIQIATVDGAVAVNEAHMNESYLEKVSGYQYDRGYLSPAFITDHSTKSAVLENANILLVNKKINSHHELQPVLDKLFVDGPKPLVVIANDVSPHVLKFFTLNKIANHLPEIVVVKSPSYGERQREMLEDIAILTGATVVDEADGVILKDITPEYLGLAATVRVTRNDTTIIDGAGLPEEVEQRIEDLKREIEETDKEYMIPPHQERIGKLLGGVAIIHVGAPTASEIKEKKDRVDDALNAVRAAIKEGIVPGGGYILAKAASAIDLEEGLNEEEAFGARILRKALYAPFRTIVENTGESPDAILANIDFSEPNVFYNAATGNIEDLFQTGIIDPALVPKISLYNAVSVASILLMTTVAITNDSSELDLSTPPMTPFQ
jgi:chaperonin GroEL